MTDTISDEVRELVRGVLKATMYENVGKGASPTQVAQAALNAEYDKALEDAANMAEKHLMYELAKAIRKMKRQP